MIASVPGSALAATFTVTNNDNDIAGSLRAAVDLANADPDADVIDVSGVSGTINLSSHIIINESVSIEGPGSGALAIVANTAVNARAFLIYKVGGLIDVKISGLTIQDGNSFGLGGCIWSQGESLELDDVVLDNCRAGESGGGLRVDGLNLADLTLTITNSVISGGNASISGGGLSLNAFAGTAVLNGVTIDGNQSPGDGAGAHIELSDSATLDVTQSTISGNVTLSGEGGGLLIDSLGTDAVTIDRTTIAGNTSSGPGAGLHAHQIEDLRLHRSTISGNTTSDVGSAVDVYYGTVLIENSTISGNEVLEFSGTLNFIGSDVSLRHSTIANNTTVSGGGAVAGDNNTLSIENSVIADNIADSAVNFSLGNDTTVTLSYSLVDDIGVTYTDGGGNILDMDPALGPLQDNGGPTQTHLPAIDSLVLDAGNPDFSAPPATDQRGLPRLSGPELDMGAVEIEVANPGAGGAGGDGAGAQPGTAGDTGAGGEPGNTGAGGDTGQSGAMSRAGSSNTGGSIGDGGEAPTWLETSKDDGGCGCELPGAPTSSSGALIGLLLWASAIVRRRRH